MWINFIVPSLFTRLFFYTHSSICLLAAWGILFLLFSHWARKLCLLINFSNWPWYPLLMLLQLLKLKGKRFSGLCHRHMASAGSIQSDLRLFGLFNATWKRESNQNKEWLVKPSCFWSYITKTREWTLGYYFSYITYYTINLVTLAFAFEVQL